MMYIQLKKLILKVKTIKDFRMKDFNNWAALLFGCLLVNEKQSNSILRQFYNYIDNLLSKFSQI